MTATTGIEAQGHCDPRFDAVRRVFESHFAQGLELGGSVAAVYQGELVIDLWAGWTDNTRSKAWASDTIVNVWSTTKGITTIAAHMLVDCGLLDLDQPVAAYWPEFGQNGKEELLVRWLLTHQAGLTAVDGPLHPGAALDWQYMTSALASQRPYWEPGTAVGYHAVTFGWLVGELVRRVTDKSLVEFVRREIADPLGQDFFLGCPPEHDGRCATVYYPPGLSSAKPTGVHPAFDDPSSLSYRSTELLITPPVNADVNSRAWRDAEFGAMNGHSNARSVARIYADLVAPQAQLLRADSIARAIAPAAEGLDQQVMMLPFPVRRSLGFALTTPETGDVRGPRSFGHSGAGGSIGFADPDIGLAFSYTMNQMAAFDLARPDVRANNLIAALYQALGN